MCHLCYFIAYGIGLFSFGVFLKPLVENFGWSRTATAGGITIYHIPMIFMGSIIGTWSNRYGPRIVMVCGLTITGATLILLTWMDTLWHLYALRAIMGLGMMAGTLIPIQSLLTHWFNKNRGLALGIAIPGIYLGGLILTPLTEYFISHYGWRLAFLYLGVIVVIGTIPLVSLIIRGKPEELGLLPYGSIKIDKLDPLPASNPGEWNLSSALKTWPFWTMFIGYFIFNGGVVGLLFHLPAYVTDLGFTPRMGAFILGLISGVCIIGGLGFGFGADRLNPRYLLISSFFMQALAMLLILRPNSLGSFYLFSLVFGLAAGGADELFALLIGKFYGTDAFAPIYGFLFISPAIAGTIGPVVAGLIFDSTQEYFWFIFLTIPAYLLGALLAFRTRPPGTRHTNMAKEA